MNLSDAKRLTFLNANFASVAFRRNGKQLAFACAHAQGRALYLMDCDGRNLTSLAAGDYSFHDLHFSPDGAFLICHAAKDDESDNICRIDTITGKMTPLAHERTAVSFDLSLDGESIVFHAWDYGSDLYVASLDGEAVVPLTTHTPVQEAPGKEARVNVYPRFSPDGNYIAFLSSVYEGRWNNPRQLFCMRSDGSDIVQLTDLPQGIPNSFGSSFLWHPDSRRIAFLAGSDPHEAAMQDPPHNNLGLVGIAGTQTRYLNLADSIAGLGSFHPEGHFLAYDTYDGNIRLIGVKDTEESKCIKVTDDDHYNTSPLFHPDGKSMVFLSKNVGDEAFGHQELYPPWDSRAHFCRDLYAVAILP